MTLQSEKISDIIEGFQNADAFDLGILMEEARFISCQLYPFSEAVGMAKKEYNRAHVQRKCKYAELVAKYRDAEGLRISEAERKAENHPDYIALYKSEYEQDARYEQGRLMLNAMVQVHSRMNQEIAEMRVEKKLYKEEPQFPQKEPAYQ
jgi:hypothetical protein